MSKLELVQTPISPEQRKKIFALQKDLALSYDDMHDLMRDWSGASSLKSENCTSAQANKIIEAMTAMQNKSADAPRAHGAATTKQIHAITAIAKSKNMDIAMLEGFIKHTTGSNDIDSLSARDASAVITGLKKITVVKKT